MLEAAEAIEAEQAKMGAPRESANFDLLQDLTKRFEELVAAIGFRHRKQN